jgi:signal transduction histidine kinase
VNKGDGRPAVLLVDDDHGNLDALEAALDDLDARLVRATSADAALRYTASDDFAIVLLDVEMPPGMSGFSAARRMRAHERSRATPIIFVTARDHDPRTTLEGYESGAVDVLFKPLDPAVLRAKLVVFLELYRLRDRVAESARLEETNRHLTRVVAELQLARADAEEAQRVKDRFLATMSHEIRTPINAIIGYAEIIEIGVAGPLTHEQRNYLERLRTSGRHLLGLVNDLLDLSKIEADGINISHEFARTGAAVAAALEVLSVSAGERGVTLRDAKPGDAGVPYIGDEQRVRQIVVNLLSNAIKFTERGGMVTIDCMTEMTAPPSAHIHGEGPWACIRVTDTGIGVEPLDQRRIFEPFQQVETGHTRTRGGTGLGLTISRRFARLMGGDLILERTGRDGSVFALWLPAPSGNESAEERSVRVSSASMVVGVRRLSEIGEALRDEVHAAVSAYTARLRTDPLTPRAAELRQPDLEDHAVAFLADIAQALIIVDQAESNAAELLYDSTEIQRTIAERHGARRHRQSWTEQSLSRDFEVLKEEAERVIRGRVVASPGETDEALAVVTRLIHRAHDISLRSWREAAKRNTNPASQ